jgi:hypothetical protein
MMVSWPAVVDIANIPSDHTGFYYLD